MEDKKETEKTEDLSKQKIELILIKMGLLSHSGLERGIEALKKRKSTDKKLEDVLVEEQIISEFDLIRARGVKYNLPLVNLSAQKISLKVLRYVSEEDAKKHVIIPVHETPYILYIATNNPFQTMLFDNIGRASGRRVSLLLATKSDIQSAIQKNYTQLSVNHIMTEIADMFSEEEEKQEEVIDFTDAQNNAVVRAVQVILEFAWQRKASDIHIEPEEKEVRVRLRIDGELVESMVFSKKVFPQLSSRMKVLAGMDIAEKRIPQDGRMTILLLGEKVNMRASTLPTIYGEKLVIRILGSSNSKGIWKLDELDMHPENLSLLRRGIHSPNGIVLVTGPTGSGKSTTVYAVLQEVSNSKVNVITVEDPVEKMLPGLNQVQVEPKAGLTFAAGLRSILRQDPDIIMIGEIRDGETASIAARAAITGHLVISTLHTNDASSTFMRLVDMGVEPYMIASSVVCVVAQRLVRKICPYCKELYTPKEEELSYWRGQLPEHFYHGRGCSMCNGSGYKGRQAVHEVIYIDNAVKPFIMRKAESEDLKAFLQAEKLFMDLGECTQLLVEQGITSIQELQKIRASMEDSGVK